MQGTYTISLLKPFHHNKNKEITKMPKVYFYDQGIANAILNNFRDYSKRRDSGSIVEQFVYWELIKTIDIRFNLNYWRTADDQEVDFILSKDEEIIAIECKSKWDSSKVPNGLKSFIRQYPETKLAIVLSEVEDELESEYKGVKILYLPLYRTFQIPEIFDLN